MCFWALEDNVNATSGGGEQWHQNQKTRMAFLIWKYKFKTMQISLEALSFAKKPLFVFHKTL